LYYKAVANYYAIKKTQVEMNRIDNYTD